MMLWLATFVFMSLIVFVIIYVLEKRSEKFIESSRTDNSEFTRIKIS